MAKKQKRVQTKRIARRRSFEATSNICAHNVTFRYWDFDAELTPELEHDLTEAAEERAKECIIEGCRGGQLVYSHFNDDEKEQTIIGWWEIDD